MNEEWKVLCPNFGRAGSVKSCVMAPLLPRCFSWALSKARICFAFRIYPLNYVLWGHAISCPLIRKRPQLRKPGQFGTAEPLPSDSEKLHCTWVQNHSPRPRDDFFTLVLCLPKAILSNYALRCLRLSHWHHRQEVVRFHIEEQIIHIQ